MAAYQAKIFTIHKFITADTKHVLTIFLCKSTGFQKCDFSIIIKVFFVPNKDDNDVWTGESSCICQPVCERVVGFTAITRNEKEFI